MSATREFTKGELLIVAGTAANAITAMRELDVNAIAAWTEKARLEVERLETIGCLLDPTAYRTEGPRARNILRICEAYLELARAVDAGAEDPSSWNAS
jgi:hypothetical protein